MVGKSNLAFVAMFAIACAFGAVLARGWPGAVSINWDALGAIATSAATFVALRFGLQANMRLDKDREAHRRILREATAQEIQRFYVQINGVNAQAAYAYKQCFIPPVVGEVAKNLRRATVATFAKKVLESFLAEPHLLGIERHFERLIYLTESESANIARALGDLPKLKRDIERTLHFWTSVDDRSIFLALVIDASAEIGNLLLAARGESRVTKSGDVIFKTSKEVDETISSTQSATDLS